MNPAPTTCPACKQVTEGKYCSHCGVSLETRSCHGCGVGLSAGARFCHLCGIPLGRDRPRSTQQAMGWIVGGAVAVVAVLAIGVRMVANGSPSVAAPRPASTMAAAPDIGSMSPRERADRLFERIMIAEERGLTDTVAFFTPMALSAYGMVGDLDADARYHVGLIQGLQGDAEAVRAQVDSIRLAAPSHLLASMLEFTLHRLTEDSAGITRAYETFLRDYEAEIATAKPEYQAHRAAIDAFRREASQATRQSGPATPGSGTGR